VFFNLYLCPCKYPEIAKDVCTIMVIDVDNSENEKRLNLDQVNEPIFLVCAADDRYSMPLTVTARSIIENLKSDRRIVLFIIDGGIKNHNKEKILSSLSSENFKVEFVPKPTSLLEDIEEFHKYRKMNGEAEQKHVTIASYYRLLISDLLPSQIEKVIYLDCDLVVRGDIEKLWQTNLEEHYLLAVPDMWICSVSHHLGLLNYKELEISPDSKYFNAGVLVINLQKWRLGKITTKAVEYLKQKREYVRYHDQDVLNALLAGQWGEIDPRWNVTPTIHTYSSWRDSPFSEDVYNSLIHEPYIVHFASHDKPWNSRRTLLKDYFFYYVDMTAWSGWRLTLWRRLWLKLVSELRNLNLWFGE